MFFLLILALIVGGSVDWVERRLYIRACRAAAIENSWPAVLKLKDKFVNGEGIHGNDIFAAIRPIPIQVYSGPDHGDLEYPAPVQSARTPISEWIQYLISRIGNALVW